MTKELLSMLKFLPFQKRDPRLANNFLKSEWEREKTASFIYLSYRLWHAFAVTSLLLLSLIEIGKPWQCMVHYLKWPIYLTNWGLMLNVLQAYLAVHLVYSAHSNTLKDADPNVELRMNGVYHVYWRMNSCSVSIAFGVTAMYWVFIYEPDLHELDLPNLVSHLLNSVIMGIDFLVVAHPFVLAHAIYPLIFVTAYVIFNLFYYLCGGLSRNGTVTLYLAMDWRSPVSCLKFVFGGYIVITSVHIFFCVACVVKIKAAHALKWRRYVQRNATANYDNEEADRPMNACSIDNSTIV